MCDNGSTRMKLPRKHKFLNEPKPPARKKKSLAWAIEA